MPETVLFMTCPDCGREMIPARPYGTKEAEILIHWDWQKTDLCKGTGRVVESLRPVVVTR